MIRRVALALAVAASLGPGVWAGERLLQASTQNYSGQVVARSSTAALVTRNASAGSAPASVAPRGLSASRTLVSTDNMEPSNAAMASGDDHHESPASRFVSAQAMPSKTSGSLEYWLRGEMKCWNKSSKAADGLGLLIVPFDADHNPLSTGRSNLVRLDSTINGGAERALPWQVQAKELAATEVLVAILSIKFADGTVWNAPEVEAVDFF